MKRVEQKTKKPECAVLLHNIRSTHNVGSMFRTADSAGVSKIYLSGYTPTPTDKFGRPRKDIAKVALGAEKTVPWEYIKNPKTLIKKLSKCISKSTKSGFGEKYNIVAIEQAKNSVDYKKIKLSNPVLLVVGNEVDGIPKEILKLCDTIAEIPMMGEKESLNVSVAFGVALFRILGV